MNSMRDLVDKVKVYMAFDIHDPEDLFQIIYQQRAGIHYSKIRDAVHIAKTSIYNF